jgi:uncharacterized protein
MSSTDSWMIRYIRQVARFRWLIILLVFGFTGFFTDQLQYVKITTDYKIFFNAENPELRAFEALETTYTQADYYLIALHTEDGDLFNARHLQAIVELTEASWQTPYSIRVDSLSNFQHTTAVEDDLQIADLVEEPLRFTDEDIIRVRNIALSEPSLVHRLVSDDGKTAGVMVTLQYPEGENSDYVPEVAVFSAALVEKFSARYPELQFARTGMTLFDYAMFEILQNDMARLLPMMLLLITFLIVATLRSVSASLISLTLLIMAAVASSGVAAWIGIIFSSPVSMAPLMVLTLALANSMHILVAALQGMQDGKDKQTAITHSLAIKFKPVMVTTITTIIGFSSLNFSDAPPMGDMGSIAALGILIAWVFSMTFLPAAWLIMPFSDQTTRKDNRIYLEKTAAFVIKNSKACILVIGLSAVTLIGLIPLNDFGETFNQFFPESSQLRRDTDFTTSHLTGPYTLEFSLGSGSANGISSPDYLQELDRFTNWLKQQPEVMHVYVFSDVQKRLNRTMHGDQDAWYKIPDNRRLAAQYLLLYEMSLPYGLDLRSQIDIDKSATKTVIILNEISSTEIREFKNRAETWLRNNAPESMQATGAGTAVMFAFLSYRMISSMLGGTALAFVLIAGVLVIALQDLRLGALSLVPNLFPAAVTLGIWALTVGQLGMIASVITAITMGLVVDDTVHLLASYSHARKKLMLSAAQSVRYSLVHVGKAVWSTTIVLTGGFLVLAYSDFSLNHQLGMLSAMTISIAIILDFFLLPALLIQLDSDS